MRSTTYNLQIHKLEVYGGGGEGVTFDTKFINMHESPMVSAEGHGCTLK